jgi:16S rRNA (cytidine1402-2'-O)-methyltransferase
MMPEKKSLSRIPGELYVVATPLGNLEDISLRALRILRTVCAIACEDTRQTIKILNRYKIKTKLISYFHPKEQQKIPKLLSLLLQGKDLALVSDAGTPGISDPGFPLIREALDRGIKVVPIPGPCAITAALSASGLPSHKFHFLSFPSPKKQATKKLLDTVKDEKETLVFYVPARKLPIFLQLIRETLGERKSVVARELTKRYEEFLRGTPSELIVETEKKEIKGEVTLLVEGKPRKSSQT